MNAPLVGIVVLTVLLGASALGITLARRLPRDHLNAESKDIIKLATAVVGTLSALALGLLIASAKTTYENAHTELRTSAAHIVLLDRVMAQYGPETDHARALLKSLIESRLQSTWHGRPKAIASDEGQASIEPVQAELRALAGDSAPQKLLQARAIQVSGDIAEAHWLVTETGDEGLPWPYVAVLVFWLALLFATFGLLAPANPTVLGVLVACAISVAAAVFLIVDMDHPFRGVLHVPDTALRVALKQLGKK